MYRIGAISQFVKFGNDAGIFLKQYFRLININNLLLTLITFKNLSSVPICNSFTDFETEERRFLKNISKILKFSVFTEKFVPKFTEIWT